MRRFLVVAVVIAATSRLAAADVSGTWNLDLVNEMGGTMRIVVSFKQDGNSLTGTCTGTEIDRMDASGEMNGSGIKWRCENADQNNKQVVIFMGAVGESGSDMKGDWTTMIKGSFTGTKQR